MPWKPMLLRGARVLARALATGDLVIHKGRVEVRYDPKSPRAYQASLANLVTVQCAALLPDEHCVEAAPPEAPRAKATVRAHVPPTAPGDVVVYADGACSGNPGPAGLGLVIVDGAHRHERSEYLGEATNNIAELTAIVRALEYLRQHEATARPAVIHTDSQYAIGLLSRGWKAKANQALVAHLRADLAGFPRVRFVYVPGHAGIPLNERADQLAREAIVERRTQATDLGT